MSSLPEPHCKRDPLYLLLCGALIGHTVLFLLIILVSCLVHCCKALSKRLKCCIPLEDQNRVPDATYRSAPSRPDGEEIL